MYCDHMSWGWGGGIMMILWMILIAALIYWVVRTARRGGNQLFQPESAIEILKKRYARGEISKEEFEERKKDLL
jgi:putative membrane protein